jgi:hypothetical protein
VAKIYIIQDVDITLTMPDDSTESFTLQRPNSADNPYYFKMLAEAPSGERIYKDPSRTRQTAFADYYPEFHFSYDHHRMFTSLLLVASKIELKTVPPFDEPLTTDVLLKGDSVTKNYAGGIVTATEGVGQRSANPVPSGQMELVFIGKKPLSWQQALNYTFYQDNA